MLGSALVGEFTSGHEVTGWDREDIDITEFQISNDKCQNLKPDIMINAAAYTDVDGAENNFELANKINGYAVGNLARVAKELDIPLVHFSTEYVFDGENQTGYQEDDEPSPISGYGRSKFLGEQELQKNTDKFYLIRLSRLFGRQGTGKRSFVDAMLEAAKVKTEIEVVDEEISLPTFAPDLAVQTRDIIEKKLPFGIYHSPSSGTPVTWYGFAKMIFETAGINVKIKPVPASRFPRPAKRPQYGVLLNTKLPPMRPWPEALREFLISN